jgi:tetrahydromethanopterin S-methyltransferase subunit G
MNYDLNSLKSRIDRIDARLSDVSSQKDELVRIIHKPGWTTVAEFALVEASLASIDKQLETTTSHYRELIQAAQQVGEK